MKKKLTASLLCLVLLVCAGTEAYAGLQLNSDARSGADNSAPTGMVFENGMAKQILNFSDPWESDYTNEGSDILRFCVYVETDLDTDNDGMADLVKVFLQVPRLAAQGNYKAATIYDPTPYDAGEYPDEEDIPFEEKPFDYEDLNKKGDKRTPSSEMTTLEAAKEADPRDWNYRSPNGRQSYASSSYYDYYITYGFAVAIACGIGTRGSEGFELCGMDQERDSHKCVVEWLAGNRRAFTDREHNIEIKADWSNGNVAMTGISYGGTLPFAVATTGVEGLKTVIPIAGIASWYDYTNSQGVPLFINVDYTDSLAFSNSGGSFVDGDLSQPKPGYESYLWQTFQDESETNGNYAPVWEMKDYTDDYENIKCSALIVQGLNDMNVTTKHADLMMQAFEKAGQTAKLVLHQEGHVSLQGHIVDGEIWEETVNKWLSHYLYGVENGIEDMAQVTVESNVDGSWKTYDHWRDFTYIDAAVIGNNDDAKTTMISSANIAEFGTASMDADFEGTGTVSSESLYYLSLDKDDMGAVYLLDIPENTTIFGVPEIHVKLSTENVDKDGMMITAVLVDYMDDRTVFPAFVASPGSGGEIPVDIIEDPELGLLYGDILLVKAVQTPTPAKNVTFGWTDLNNPGGGYDSKEYVLQDTYLEAGKFYDYTFYMLPTVYTVAPGHHLALVLTTWDPYRAFLDEEYELDPTRDARYSFYTYGYTVDNTSIEARIPVR